MRTKLYLLVVMLLGIGAGTAFAQGVLEVQDISQPNDVFSSADDEAAVVIRCHQSLSLTFSSSMDKQVNVFKTLLQGSDSVYYMSFHTGNRYRGRELTVVSPGFAPLNIMLELEPKQLLTYKISDPNALIDAGCYREHRNRGISEMKNANYEEARNQFEIARECSDVDKEENEHNIIIIDSIVSLRNKGDEAYKMLEYAKASSYYTDLLVLNPNDSYAESRKTACIQNYVQDCTSIYLKADYYFKEKEYDKARQLYEKVIAMECQNRQFATDKLNAISRAERDRQDHSRVITYEIQKNAPLGISYGKYNMHKVGGFIAINFNPHVFNAIQGEARYGDESFAEANLSFGWTIKIVNPVWIHFGPGVTGKMYYGTYATDAYPSKGFGETDRLNAEAMGADLELPKAEAPADFKDGWKKANVAVAVSPVVGVTAKYSYFAFRLTYQYRWPVKRKLEDFLGTSRLTVGVGVAF